MCNQKGFIQLLIAPAILFLNLGYLLGISTDSTVVSNFITRQEILPFISSSIAEEKIKHSDLAKPDPNKVNISGNFNISGQYNIDYSASMPKKGGAINGNFSGTCEGEVTGNVEAPNEVGLAPLQGEVVGKCKPIPTFSFKIDFKATYEGKVDYNTGKIAVVYESSEPVPTRSYTEIFFTP